MTAVFMRSYRICPGAPPIASRAARWQRRTVCRSWCMTKRAQISRLKPSTSENSRVIEKLRGFRLTKAAELAEAGIEETLTYYAFRGALAAHPHQQPARAPPA